MSLDLPNFTLIIQFVLFFGAFLVLNTFVFTPLLKVIEERRKKTIETFKKTEEFSQKTLSLSHDYEDKLKEYRMQLKQKIEGAKQGLLKQQTRLLEETRETLSKDMKHHRQNVQHQVIVAEKELAKDIEEASLNIAQKFGA